MDRLEAHYLDEFPTAYHMITGRNKGLQQYCKHATLRLDKHLERLKFDPTKRSHPISLRSKPKIKRFGDIDKKNLLEL